MPFLRPADYGIPQEPLVPLPPSTPPVSTFITWTPAGGPTTELSKSASEGIMLGGEGDPGTIIGLDMPPLAETEVELPPGGGLLTHQRWGTRSVALPIVIHADTLEGLELYRRELVASMNPGRGDGVLTLAYPDGERRHLKCAYSEGIDAPGTGRQGGGLYYDTYTITLKARDPHVYGDEVKTVFLPPSSGEDFFPVPFTITKATQSGAVNITGQLDVWPTWVLHGPMFRATLRHFDTQVSLVVTPDIGQGESLIVRTDPRTPPTQKFVTAEGSPRWDAAGDFPALWQLRPGPNRVDVTIEGSGASTSIDMIYEPRYLTA